MLEVGAVALAARYIPSEKIDIREVADTTFTAACVFTFLDMYAHLVYQLLQSKVLDLQLVVQLLED